MNYDEEYDYDFTSKHYRELQYNEEWMIVWHAIFGMPILVPRAITGVFHRTTQILTPSDYFIICGGVSRAFRETGLINRGDIVEPQRVWGQFAKFKRAHINKVVNLSLVVSEACAFNNEKIVEGGALMSLDLAKRSVSAFLERIKEYAGTNAHINFCGVEPLLNWEVIKETLPFIVRKSDELGIKVRLSINTNLGLLTEEIATTLKEYGVEFSTNINSVRTGNNTANLDRDPHSAYAQSMKGVKLLKRIGYPLKGFTMKVTRDNLAEVDKPILDWAHKYGIEAIRIDVDVVKGTRTKIETIVQKLIDVRKYAKTKGITVFGSWSRPFENLGLNFDQTDVCYCSAQIGGLVSVSPYGKVFPCKYSSQKLCDCSELCEIQETPSYNGLLERRIHIYHERHDVCYYCSIFGACLGGCTAIEESMVKSSKPRRMCEFYRAMTEALLRETVDEALLQGKGLKQVEGWDPRIKQIEIPQSPTIYCDPSVCR